jgi:hypothetical protein
MEKFKQVLGGGGLRYGLPHNLLRPAATSPSPLMMRVYSPGSPVSVHVQPPVEPEATTSCANPARGARSAQIARITFSSFP